MEGRRRVAMLIVVMPISSDWRLRLASLMCGGEAEPLSHSRELMHGGGSERCGLTVRQL